MSSMKVSFHSIGKVTTLGLLVVASLVAGSFAQANHFDQYGRELAYDAARIAARELERRRHDNRDYRNQDLPRYRPEPPRYRPEPRPMLPRDNRPPRDNGLSGYCPDYDHSQFAAAKSFSYSGSGLNLTSDESVRWALEYNNSHSCGTLPEYSSRFTALKNFAYSGSGLNMTSSEAIQYALANVEYVSTAEAGYRFEVLTAIKEFAYSGSYLNYDSSTATRIAREWIDQRCEGVQTINELKAAFVKEYQFAYSGSGLNMDSTRAREYALGRMSGLTYCSRLLYK